MRPIPPHRQRKVSVGSPFAAEGLGVAALLLLVFLLRLQAAFRLNALGAFDQYNLFFDTDPSVYVSAIANGWTFNREFHPGFALFFNVPIRAVDAVASALGISSVGAIRNGFAIVLSPLCGLIAGVFLWLACVRAGLSRLARIGAVVLLQGSFSQVVFAAIPESVAVSGMLCCVLLWAAAHGAARRERLDLAAVRAGWLLLCVAMTGVGVPNGMFCVGAWLALRAENISWRRWALEAVIGVGVMVVSVLALRFVDAWVYTLPTFDTEHFIEQIREHALARQDLPKAVSARMIELPAHAVESIYAPPVVKFDERPPPGSYRYPFGFIASPVTASRLLVCWFLTICGLVASLPRLGASALARSVAVVLAFNAILHSFFGLQPLLYSQHWVAFLTFAIAAGLDRIPRIGGALVVALGIVVTVHSFWTYAGMIAILDGAIGAY